MTGHWLADLHRSACRFSGRRQQDARTRKCRGCCPRCPPVEKDGLLGKPSAVSGAGAGVTRRVVGVTAVRVLGRQHQAKSRTFVLGERPFSIGASGDSNLRRIRPSAFAEARKAPVGSNPTPSANPEDSTECGGTHQGANPPPSAGSGMGVVGRGPGDAQLGGDVLVTQSVCGPRKEMLGWKVSGWSGTRARSGKRATRPCRASLASSLPSGAPMQ